MAARVTASKAKTAPKAQQSIRDRLGPPPGAPAQDGAPGPLDAEVIAFEPVRLTPVDEAEVKRVPLFYVGDRAYSIPVEAGMEVGLEANHIMARLRMQGVPASEVEGAVMDYILGQMVGEDGYAALRGFKGLKPEDFEKITAIAYRLTLGALEVPKAAGNG